MLLPLSQYRKHTFHQLAVADAVGDPMIVTDIHMGGGTVLTVQVEGVTTATIAWKGRIRSGKTEMPFVDIPFENVSTGVAATTATADGLYRAVVAGLDEVVADLDWTSGDVTIVGILT